ncbi:MAG: GNAT family N-acetyltransferase [Erysipelothrix sp.]|nr:GNAT family N-acetyltransferase [Erysipelothrix sp.]
MLETDRLILRPIEKDDAQALYEYSSDPLVTEYVSYNTYKSMHDAYDSLQHFFLNRDPNKHFNALAIILKESQRMIGTVDSGPIQMGDTVEIGYVLHRDYWNQGLMTEAVMCYVRHLFEDKNIRRIEITHLKQNEGSRRVIEKVGFVYEGDRRQHTKFGDTYVDMPFYSLLKGDLK